MKHHGCPEKKSCKNACVSILRREREIDINEKFVRVKGTKM